MSKRDAVLVTGGANGLGREYVKYLTSVGVNVVVGDIDGDRLAHVVGDGRSGSGKVIGVAGDVADAEYCQRLVDMAVAEFGSIQGAVCNAGIVRDRSFHKMAAAEWDEVLEVHLTGSFNVAQAAWPHFRANQYGRLVLTTSAAGLFGNFGQANYSAAKMGLVGLAQTLAIEGARHNILVNCISPMAATRMTEGLLNEEQEGRLRPELVAPVVGFLVSVDCQSSGRIVRAGGGVVRRVAIVQSKGVDFGPQRFSHRDIVTRWTDIDSVQDWEVGGAVGI